MGAGCSKCAGLSLTAELAEQSLVSNELDETSKAILTAIEQRFAGAVASNIEDYLSELIDLLAIAERRDSRGATIKKVSLGDASYSLEQLRTATEQIKRSLASIIEKKTAIAIHRDFVRAVHRPRRVGKSAPGQVVDYLLLNYDTVLEDALALERIPFADGIDGGVTGWWNPQTFDRDGLAARVFKLHGSIDWCELRDDPLPRRIGSRFQLDAADERKILIWPASTKYREAQLDPFAQLMDRARRVLRPSRGAQRVLLICGYGFGDAHINIEVARGLRESSGNLTVIAFTHEDEPTGSLATWHKDPSLSEQVLIFANRGFFHGTDSAHSTADLLWWKFENITRLLGGER